MKNSAKKELEKMVKEFNARIENSESKYEITCMRFGRGQYSCTISYGSVFYSTDFSKLMELVTKEDLCIFLCAGKGETKARINIQ